MVEKNFISNTGSEGTMIGGREGSEKKKGHG